MASMSVSMTPKVMVANKPTTTSIETTRLLPNMVSFIRRNNVNKMQQARRRRMVVRAAPDQLSENVEKSIKDAQETCSDDPVSSECVAAWDVVEEVSAAASHARDKAKDSDPLEVYCKDNPETDECKTYDN